MKIAFVTFGCKANQYDTEKFRQELQARGATVVEDAADADACVVNTCTVTNSADAAARKLIRKLRRDNPDLRVVVAGCSAALRGDEYDAMSEVFGVVGGHDAIAVASTVAPELSAVHDEAIGSELLGKNRRTRGWIKIQDGCDRRCSFCATRLARGRSRSRTPDDVVAEARLLARHHRELVFTGVHIGHYGIDLEPESTLSALCERLVGELPEVRFRLGSIEATEIDDRLVDLLAEAENLVPHLHVPMQSGADPVLRRMRRWHTREQYRSRVLEIADRVACLGLGADVIVGFPGETEEDFESTRALVEELPFTYLHVFPYSQRDGTVAADLPDDVDGNVKAERGRVLREIAMRKGIEYQQRRHGQGAQIVVEEDEWGVTEDYLRVQLLGDPASRVGDVVYAPLTWDGDRLVAAV